MEDRTRFELTFGEGPRDRRVADWIDMQLEQGRSPGELIKNLIDEIITGTSSLTGKALSFDSGYTRRPISQDDPVADRLRAMPD